MSIKLMSTIIQNNISTPVNHEKEVDDILSRLLNYVKECQKKYGGKTELATEFDSCVAGLCSLLECVFQHGLRTKPQETNTQTSFTLKQMSDIVSHSLHLNNDQPSFWPFIKHHLTKHEQERYSVLRHVWTDFGRGRAWIRSALNERSLERYLHSAFSEPELLTRYYEDWALLCDQDKNSMLPNMAAGLGSILFAISIDKPELNNLNAGMFINPNEPIINASETNINTELKRKKRIASQIISFDNDDDLDNPSTSESVTIPSSSASIDSIEAKETNYETQSINNNEPTRDSDNKIRDSLDNVQPQDITLTPIQHSDIGELKIVPSDDNYLDSPYDETIEISMDIAAVLQKVEDNKEEHNQLRSKISELTKENENLRKQLRQYISAVQMLSVDSQVAHKELAKLSMHEGTAGNEPNYLVEAKFYENKLVQVAEMHGELMEFNEHLQKMLTQKDLNLELLKKELCAAKGTNYDITTETDTFSAVALTTICIPSAFLTGTGSEAHHVYQVYIKSGNDDWNIYRRYAQFYSLHSDLKKLDPIVANFDFPPKKSIGNKDANLVEDRRKRLQTYLRKILNHWPELGNCNSRYLLEQHLSFFRDEPNQGAKDKNNSKRKNKYTSNENHYTGL